MTNIMNSTINSVIKIFILFLNPQTSLPIKPKLAVLPQYAGQCQMHNSLLHDLFGLDAKAK